MAIKLVAWLAQCDGYWGQDAGGESQALSCLPRASEEEGHPRGQAEVSHEGWVWKCQEAETKWRSGMGWGVAGRRQGVWDSVVTL